MDKNLLDLLCENLLRNSSVSHLYILYPHSHHNKQHLPSEIIEQIAQIINTLIVRNIPLEGFGIRVDSFSPNESTRLMNLIDNLLVAYPNIKKLVLDCPLNAIQQRTLMSSLQHNCKELKVLRIDNDSEAPENLVEEWIRYIATSPIRKVDMPLGDMADKAFLEEILKENTSLENLSNFTLNCTERNRMLRAQRDQEVHIAVNLRPKISDSWYEQDERLNYLADMPIEIVQAILNMTDLPSILKFRTTSSYFVNLMKSSSFWRSFYCSQAHCVPSEVLEISDMTYGTYLYNNNGTGNPPISFWEYITRAWYWTSASLVQKNGSDQAYLKYHRDFIEELYKAYPELATLRWQLQSIGPHYRVGTKKVNKWIDKPYTKIVFKLYVYECVVYYIIFELHGDNSISGIFLWNSNFTQRAMDAIAHVFDWFSARSIGEAIDRARSMVKSLIAANTADWANCLTNSLPKIRMFSEFDWCRTIAIQQQCLSDIGATISSQGMALMGDLNLKHNEPSKFTAVVQSLSNKLLQQMNIAVPDYQQLRSWIERAQSNEKYVVSGHEWNFTGNMWGIITPNPSPFRLKLSEKPRKSTLPAMIYQFMRRLLNLILMPVLKSLWYPDTYDSNFAVHSFVKTRAVGDNFPYYPKQWTIRSRKQLHQFQAYLADIWVHPDDVTVQHAVPHAWPLAAASLARRITPSLCNAVASLLHYHWDMNQHGTTSRNLDDVDAFFALVSQFDLIPLEHVKSVQELLTK